jgi:hypothetical protein
VKDGKNRMNDLLDALGHPRSLCTYESAPLGPNGPWQATATLAWPTGLSIAGTGTGLGRTSAEGQAAADVLRNLDPAVRSAADWAAIRVEAQAGDALIKLAAYLSTPNRPVGENSAWLQRNEANHALARLFDVWMAAGADELRLYGDGCGDDAKATLVEAILWRRFRDRVLVADAVGALSDLRKLIEGASGA